MSPLVLKGKNDDIYLSTLYAEQARPYLKGSYGDYSRIPSKYVRLLVVYLIHKFRFHLSVQFIDHALITGEFLEYDNDSGSYKIGAMHGALFMLKENIDLLRKLSTGNYIKDFLSKYTPKANPQIKNNDALISIPNEELLYPFALFDCDLNISDLCIAIIRALHGNDERLHKLKLRPAFPLETQGKRASLNPTIEELDRWLWEME